MNKVKFNVFFRFALLASTLLLVSACGGSSSSSSSQGSPIVSRGIATGFGSVYVNQHRFRTGGASFSLDDAAGSEDELRIGMLVTVYGSRDGDAYHADRIVYDNELEGPVTDIVADPGDATRKSLTVLGQDVLVNSLTTFDDDGGGTFDTLTVGDVVEVSGYVSDSLLVATRIELQADADEIELKGLIENLSASRFDIDGFRVDYGPTTEIDDDIDLLVDGMHVEAQGRPDSGGATLIAAKIETEDDGLPSDADEVEIEGAIADYNPADHSFTIAGVSIDASTATVSPASLVLADGVLVEVEGARVGGTVLAQKLERKGREVEITDEDANGVFEKAELDD